MTARVVANYLNPKKGERCVFCSYGDVPCPPIQASHQGNKQISHIDMQ